MGDNFDGCVPVWNYELAARRLIRLLQQNQDYCDETQCLNDLPNLPGSGGHGLMFVMFWLLMAAVLFFLRPRFSTPTTTDKLGDNPRDSPDGPPPSPMT